MNYEQLLTLALVGTGGGIYLLAVIRSPALGIASLIVAGLFFPTEVETGTSTALNLPFLMAPVVTGVWLLGMADRRRAPAWIRSQSVVPLMLLLVVSSLSLVVGQFPWFPASPAPLRAQLGGLGIFLFSGGVFLLSAHLLRDIRWLRRITYLFLAAGALRIVLALLDDLPALGVPLASVGTLGSMFWTWLLAIACAIGFFNRELSRVWRLASLALAAATLYVTLVRNPDWASGWAPGCVAIVVIAFMRYPRRMASLVFSVVAVAAVKYDSVVQFLWTQDQQYSYFTRVEAAGVLSRIMAENPLLGFGPANYYHYTQLHPLLGWYVPFSSHNNYLDIIAQTGLLGFVCFLWFLAALAFISLRLRKQSLPGFPRAFVYGAIGGLAGTLCAAALGDWLLPFVYNIGISGFRASILAWIFLGGLVAVEQVYGRVEQEGDKHAIAIAA